MKSLLHVIVKLLIIGNTYTMHTYTHKRVQAHTYAHIHLHRYKHTRMPMHFLLYFTYLPA